ncbi:MAG: CcmD family protein [Acidobacteriota bacterium]
MELSGANTGVVVVNLIIWTGIFLWLLRLNKQLRDMEKKP